MFFARYIRKKLHRTPALLLALLLLLLALRPGPARATEEGSEEFIEPTLADDAPEYDVNHPELLDPDMLIARSAILIEARNGNVIYEKNADEVLYPASTTKIMTALLALQWGDPEEKVPTSANAVMLPEGSATIPLSEGENVPLLPLVYATMLRSGNDGAIALAEYLGGSEAGFVEMMNETAYFLGCTNTHFANSHGLHDPSHFSTARDMAVIAQNAMQDENFRDIVATANYTMPDTNKHPQKNLVNGNLMIRQEEDNNNFYAPAIGIKTGFHNQAGYCFVGAARQEGVELISVVFYTSRRGRWQDTRRLMEYGFSQYEGIDPITVYNESPRVISLSGFDPADGDLGEVELGIRPIEEDRDVYMIGTLEEIETYKRDFSKISHVNWTREHRAPVSEGEVLGILTFYPQDEEPAEYELYAPRSVAARLDAPPSLEEIIAYTQEDPNPFPRITLDFLIEFLGPPLLILFLLWLIIHNIRKRTRKRRKREKRLPTPKRRHFQ